MGTIAIEVSCETASEGHVIGSRICFDSSHRVHPDRGSSHNWIHPAADGCRPVPLPQKSSLLYTAPDSVNCMPLVRLENRVSRHHQQVASNDLPHRELCWMKHVAPPICRTLQLLSIRGEATADFFISRWTPSCLSHHAGWAPSELATPGQQHSSQKPFQQP